MDIRDAQIEDAEAIALVHVAAERTAYSGLLPDNTLESLSLEAQTDAWRKRITLKATRTLVALVEGDISGWVNFGSSRDTDESVGMVELRAMYIRPDNWRQGIGMALWMEMSRELQKDAVPAVTLWVLAENARARRFYEQAGFVIDEGIVKNVDYDGEQFQAVRYRHRL